MKLDYTTVSDPQFAAADESAIDCLVQFTAFHEPLPFTARPDDVATEHGPEIFKRCLAGEFGPVAPFTPTET